jgi:hypothetical protein
MIRFAEMVSSNTIPGTNVTTAFLLRRISRIKEQIEAIEQKSSGSISPEQLDTVLALTNEQYRLATEAAFVVGTLITENREDREPVALEGR